MKNSKHEIKAFEPIDFNSVNKIASAFASHVLLNKDEIIDILLGYESFEVANDEIARTLDLLENISENKNYFSTRVGEVTSFLPRNQPLYALTCFVLVPSLMSSQAHFRIPHSMGSFFPNLLKVIKLNGFFPNVVVSKKERLEFLKERSALLVDPEIGDSLPVTDVVIFTGTSLHAERLRLIFDQRTLFISNGSGHNPLVVSQDADVPKSVEAAVLLQLYNQGQDCAAPNTILVHKNVFQQFLDILHAELNKVKVGQYIDISCRVGPISDPKDLKRICEFFVDNRDRLDQKTKGVIRTAEGIVEPTIICKPLSFGGNYSEIFAPVFFVQEYEQDTDLALYFENPSYSPNAMYISLYGNSKYVKNLVGKKIKGKILHQTDTILCNTHPHAPGIERGTQPYGGYGYSASSISINGKTTPKPTCPQRDIYENLVIPLLEPDKIKERVYILSRATKKITKNIPKLMGLKLEESAVQNNIVSGSEIYLDVFGIEKTNARYVKLVDKQFYSLLDHPNARFIVTMNQEDRGHVETLQKFLIKNKKIDLDKLVILVYAIPKKKNLSEDKNTGRQLHFFRNVYQLLFAKDSGPRLAQFLVDADREKVCELLDV